MTQILQVTQNKLDYSYDEDRDQMTIEGTKYSGDFFRGLGSLLPIGVPFEITERRDDGMIVVRRLDAIDKE